MIRKALVVSVFIAFGVEAALAAFVPGGSAYTKRVSTDLLSDSRALAPVSAQIGYARKLRIDQVKGLWLHVQDGANAGWVFSGNVAEEKPSDTKGMDGIPMAASQTSATAAARPLAPAAEQYGDRKGLAEAKSDVLWLEAASDAVKHDQVDTFLKENRKGEFQ
jgi:hypothetical protein